MSHANNIILVLAHPSQCAGRRMHPLPVKIMHWINAAVMLVMITSGWKIYNDDVISRGFRFSGFWRLGTWAAGASTGISPARGSSFSTG